MEILTKSIEKRAKDRFQKNLKLGSPWQIGTGASASWCLFARTWHFSPQIMQIMMTSVLERYDTIDPMGPSI